MNHTIMIVDDEGNVLRALNRDFRQEPYGVTLASSAEEGLKLIEAGETPSVVISDERMPGMNGSEFLREVRNRLPDSIRIILTGHGDLESAITAINEGEIYRYILKPWSSDDLRLLVRHCIERFELVQQNRELTEALEEKNTELNELSKVLEEMVQERNRELQERVVQLEGRDRILEHLLTVHPLEDILTTVLEVVRDAVGAERACVHLYTDEGDLVPRAALLDEAVESDPSRLADDTLDEAEKIAVAETRASDEKAADLGDRRYGFPIHRGDLRLGVLEVAFSAEVGLDVIEVVGGYVQQASIAICETQMFRRLEEIDPSKGS